MPVRAAEELETKLKKHPGIRSLHDFGQLGRRIIVTRKDSKPLEGNHFAVISRLARKVATRAKRDLTVTTEQKANYASIIFGRAHRPK